MIGKQEARGLVNALFEETGLVIGGLVALHEVDDDFLWPLMRGLDGVRGRYLRRLEDEPEESAPTDSPRCKPHPAVSAFLERVRRGTE